MILLMIAAATTGLAALALLAARPQPRRIPVRVRDDARPHLRSRR